MNLPNKLTIMRMVMVPVMVVFLSLEGMIGETADILAFIVFIAASFTDFLDGYLARKWDMISDFGKFMDPLADKLLVGSAAICLCAMGRIPAFVVVILIGREFVISGFRLVAAGKGVVIAAGPWGKIKTVAQMIMTIFLILHINAPAWHAIEVILIVASVVLALASMADYIFKNLNVLEEQQNGG